MRFFFTLALIFFLTLSLSAQNDKVRELVSQGIGLHDQGKHKEAISIYLEALEIDENSTLANYELSYTYMTTGQYDLAIKHSKMVIEQDNNHQHEAFIVLGSSLDMLGKSEKAIKTYEEGLMKFPNSNLLNYNLALTCFNQKDYNKAEKAAIKSVKGKPEHGSSHLILSAIMQAKGQRVKSLLPLYYFLMLEPDSKRSKVNYESLIMQLGQGVNRENDANINVNVPLSSQTDADFGPAEMMISLLAASSYIESNKDKSKMELFIETNKGFFGILGELKNENTGIWWDLYVTRLCDLIPSDNYEAYSYYISQSTGIGQINQWIADNPEKMQKLYAWMNKWSSDHP